MLRSDLWASAFVRRHNNIGEPCVVSRKGDPIAGQIFIEIDHLNGTVSLLTPAPSSAREEGDEDRLFVKRFVRAEPAVVRARQVMAFVRSDIGAVRDERSSETVFYRMQVPPLSPAGVRAADKLIFLAGALIGDGDTSTAFGTWSIADVDLAMALQRLVANGDPVPEPLRAYAAAQWARPSVRAYVEHERAPFVPYHYDVY